MIHVSNISRNFLKNKNYEVMILDVNSLFLFGGKNSIHNMYAFIDSIKKSIENKNLLVINVIDNGISQRLLRRFPYYKANRHQAVQSNNINVNKFSSSKGYKYKINRVHKIDFEFPNHLTFYLPGEADFKVGQILKFLQERTELHPSEILTVSFDKDYLLCNTLSDVLLKRFINNTRYWYLFDKDTDVNGFKKLFKLEDLNIRNVYEFFYYLVINGDEADNIKELLNKNNTTKIMNLILEKYNKINVDLICDHIGDFNSSICGNDVYDNCYLVDLFNKDAFTNSQKNTMTYVLSSFLRKNNVKVFE